LPDLRVAAFEILQKHQPDSKIAGFARIQMNRANATSSDSNRLAQSSLPIQTNYLAAVVGLIIRFSNGKRLDR
jgi:hypothetical protein